MRSSRILRAALLPALWFAGAIPALAQGIYEQKSTASQVTLYKLSKEQLIFLQRNQFRADTQWLYSTPVKSMNADSFIKRRERYNSLSGYSSYRNVHQPDKRELQYVWNVWENGYYLIPWVTGINSVTYLLLENPAFHTAVWNIGTEHFVLVTDSAGRTLNNVQVMLDTSICYFDAGIGGYKIWRKSLSGTITVSDGKNYLQKYVYGGSQKAGGGRVVRDKYKYSKPFAQGYLVTNKPRYRFGDTVFYKAFIVDKKGKPWKSEILLTAGYSQRIARRITAAEPGVYHGWFIVSDTFHEGSNYFQMYDRKNRLMQSQNLWVEDYETEELTFRLFKTRDPQIGTGATIYAEAITKGGLPVMDGKVKAVLSLYYLRYADEDSFTFPLKWNSNRWELTQMASPSGITEIYIPDSLFIRGPGTWQVRVSFTTSDNRVYESVMSLEYSTNRDRLESSLLNDTLVLINYAYGKSSGRKLLIKEYSAHDKLTTYEVTTPVVKRIGNEVRMVHIYSGDTLLNTLSHFPAAPVVTGKRTHDSAIISFRSPSGVLVHYRIYRNNVIVLSGSGTSLSYAVLDKSRHSYHLQYGTPSVSIEQTAYKTVSFHLAEKSVTVKISTPTEVYPGQKVPVDITVTDVKGKPVNRINLTAWAVSKEVPGIVEPDLPYLGLVKDQRSLPQRAYYLQPAFKPASTLLAGWMVPAFGLRSNPYFGLHYPGGWQVLTDTSPGKITEAEVFSTHRGQEVTVRYVMSGDTLLYVADATREPDVFRMRPGVHKLTIRTFDRIYRLENIVIKAGLKNFIALNEDSLKRMGIGDTIRPGRYTQSEQIMLNRHMLYFRYQEYAYDTLIIKRNGEVYHATPTVGNTQNTFNFREKTYTPGKTNRYFDNQYFLTHGPFNPGDRIEMIWKNGYMHEFVFDSGYTYSMTRTELIKMRISPPADEVRYFPQSANSMYRFTAKHWFNPYAPRTVTPAGVYYKPPVAPRIDLPEYNYRDYTPAGQVKADGYIRLFLKDVNQPVYRYWLFNLADSSRSFLQSGWPMMSGKVEGTVLHDLNYRAYYMKPGMAHNKYLLVLRSNDSMWLVKPLTLDSQKWVYLALSGKSFRRLRESEFLWMDRMVKTLGKSPMAVFEDTPTVQDKPYMLVYPAAKGRTRLEFTVAGPGQTYVVDHAFVVLERDGFFVKGAITNEDGVFVMEDIPAGRYMLKIKGQNYHYWISYNLVVESGKLHLGRIVMKPYARFKVNTMTFTGEGAAEGFSTGYSSGAAADMNFAPVSEERYSNIESVAITSKKRKMLAAPAMRGVRSESAGTYIDGMKVSGNASYRWKTASDEDADGMADTTSMQNMFDRISGDEQARRVRRFFRDYAYWIPSLNTGKNGRVGFTVTYPDNITGWQTFVPAMDGKRHTGLGQVTVNAYKPVSVNLGLPLFLTEGDRFMLHGKWLNYTGRSIKGQFEISAGDQSHSQPQTAGPIFRDSLFVAAGKPGDTLRVTASVTMENGYRDAELRTIAVNAATITTGKSSFAEITTDTTLLFAPLAGDLEMNVVIYNHRLALVNEMLKQLEMIGGAGNQFEADRLMAMLAVKDACSRLNLPFNREAALRESLRRLKNAQRNDGSFSTYRRCIAPSEDFTLYAAEVLHRAHMLGYENNAWLNAARYLTRNRLPVVSGDDLAATLLCLRRLNRDLQYDTLIKKLVPETLSASGRLDHILLLQALNKPVQTDYVTSRLESTTDGLVVFQSNEYHHWSLYHDEAAITLKAWQILFNTKTESAARRKMVDWLVEKSPFNIHTRALAAEAMISEYSTEGISKTLVPELAVNDKALSHSLLPASYRLRQGETLKLSHRGAPVYIASNRLYRTYNPVSDAQSFSISCNWPSDTIGEGDEFTVKVNVLAKKSHQGVVVEVPIPAGLGYAEKISDENPAESDREYRTDRVLIYCDDMPFGQHTFSIRLRARFAGEFHAAPARAALQFYPDKAAYTGPLTLYIEGK